MKNSIDSCAVKDKACLLTTGIRPYLKQAFYQFREEVILPEITMRGPGDSR